METYTLPDLPYELDALEPHISSETLQYHYKKHHAGYVSKLNDLVEGSNLAQKSLEEIILTESPGTIFNNAAQIWNHSFYWNSMTPNTDMQPTPELAGEIKKYFGTPDEFKEKFVELATVQFGSGWAWLVKNDAGKLDIITTSNADNPLRKGLTPLLVCDVWEHAYYIDYRNDREIYVEKFLDLINWDFIQKNFEELNNVQEELKLVGSAG